MSSWLRRVLHGKPAKHDACRVIPETAQKSFTDLSYRRLTDAQLVFALADFRGGTLDLTGNTLTARSASVLVDLLERHPDCTVWLCRNPLTRGELYAEFSRRGRLEELFKIARFGDIRIDAAIARPSMEDRAYGALAAAIDAVDHKLDNLCDIVAALIAARCPDERLAYPTSVSLDPEAAYVRQFLDRAFDASCLRNGPSDDVVSGKHRRGAKN